MVLTACSTFLAAAATPFFTKALAGQLVPVPAAGLVVSTAQVVLAPVALGLLLKRLAPRAVARVAPAGAPVAVLTVALICASVIGSSAAAIRSAGWVLGAAVVLLHAGGFALGYGAAKASGYPERTARTLSIEVGMQNRRGGRKQEELAALLSFPSQFLRLCPGSCALLLRRGRSDNTPGGAS